MLGGGIADCLRGQPLIRTVEHGRHREDEAQAANRKSACLGFLYHRRCVHTAVVLIMVGDELPLLIPAPPFLVIIVLDIVGDEALLL